MLSLEVLLSRYASLVSRLEDFVRSHLPLVLLLLEEDIEQASECSQAELWPTLASTCASGTVVIVRNRKYIWITCAWSSATLYRSILPSPNMSVTKSPNKSSTKESSAIHVSVNVTAQSVCLQHKCHYSLCPATHDSALPLRSQRYSWLNWFFLTSGDFLVLCVDVDNEVVFNESRRQDLFIQRSVVRHTKTLTSGDFLVLWFDLNVTVGMCGM